MRFTLSTASYAVGTLLGLLVCGSALADQSTFASNAGSMSVTDVADNGDNIGMDEKDSFHEGDPNKYIGREQVYYFRKAGETAYAEMPKLDGFSAAFAYDLSNNGVVVGASTRAVAPGSNRGGSRAVVWTPENNALTALPLPADYIASRATSISADGTRAVGVAIGHEGYAPVVWDLRDGTWTVTRLATIHVDNPYMAGAGSIVISDDGKSIYAPLTYEKIFEPGMVLPLYRSATYGYTQHEGTWVREKVFEHGLQLAEASNRGHLTGTISTNEGTRAYLFSPTDGFRILDTPPGSKGNASAFGVNDEGTVVGYYDDRTPDGGPVAMRWSADGTEAISLKNAKFSIAFDINNAGTIVGLIEPPFENPEDDHTEGFVLN